MFPLPSSSPSAEYQPTGDRFPVALLWLPYVALTLLLSALLVASFLHFHCKNGHKYFLGLARGYLPGFSASPPPAGRGIY